MARRAVEESLTVEESFDKMTVDQLKPLARLLGDQMLTRKGELVGVLTKAMRDLKRLRSLYDGLDETGKLAVQEATHDRQGELNLVKFEARHGQTVSFSTGDYWRSNYRPTALRLFFPAEVRLPHDLKVLLSSFVPKPPPLKIAASDELPRSAPPPGNVGVEHREVDEVAPLVRETARSSLHNVMAVLRLIDSGGVQVGDKTRRPSASSLKAVAKVLLDGDFYGESEALEDSWDPASDLVIQPFAWPMLMQAGGLAQPDGTKLRLTPAGRKATAIPPHEVIRTLWNKWLGTKLLDEFNRINAIKGQQGKGKGGLTAVEPRRRAVVGVLAKCPVRQWVALDELFRILKILADDLVVSRDAWRLYIAEPQYGSLADGGEWEMLEGRFTLAFLFEYAATLGLIDIARVTPDGARDDFNGHWGTDDLSCLSRYDGLLWLRINPLGAWVLGLTDRYVPEAVAVRPVFRVLPNLDVVAGGEAPSPADVLVLERFTVRQSNAVWKIARAPILAALEEGLKLAEFREFLTARSVEPLPDTVEVFLTDLERKASQLTDRGAARLIACKDPLVALELAGDRKLRNLCQLAGDRCLVFRTGDEAAVRRALHDLGYVLPPP